MRHLLLVLCLYSLTHLLPSWGEERPVPQFKPYPVKKAKDSNVSEDPMASGSNPGGTGAPASSGAAASSPSGTPKPMSPNSWDSRDHNSENARPFGVEPVQSLKAHPPTSGKEPMLMLDNKSMPLTPAIHESDRLNYYDCKGVLAPWFQELLTAELNYFSELVEFPLIKGNQCVVTVGTPKSLTPGRISVQMYANAKDMNDCVMDGICFVFRSVNLIPKNGGVYRSYFLSDMFRKVISQQCVNPKGKLFSNTTCYSVD
jgi:hypothetical protein